MRRSLAGEVRKKQQTVRTGRSCSGQLGDDIVDIAPSPLRLGHLALTDSVTEPAQASPRRECHSHQVPRIGNGMAVGVEFTGRVKPILVRGCEHNS